MPRLSFGLLFLVLLGILGVQNWQPSLAITFLGRRSPTLPFSLWIVAAVLLGYVTGATILWLIGPDTGRSDRPRPRKPSAQKSPSGPEGSGTRDQEDQGEDAFNFDDNFDNQGMDDRDINDPPIDDPVEDSEPIPADKPPQTPNYRPGPRPSAPYSYSYRPSRKVTPRTVDDRPLNPPPRSVAKGSSKEDVYDAEYRILTPPYPEADSTPPPPPEDDWDDWDDWTRG